MLMITGFNTDIDHVGRVYHVQTEDRGLNNPIVDTLVYCGGEIIASRQRSYSDLAESGAYSEDEVLRRMEIQHQAMIREILNGKYDVEGPKPFGHNIVTNRSLDEVVLSFLRLDESEDSIAIQPIEEQVLIEGTCPSLRMRVVEQSSHRPVECALVTIRLVSTDTEPRDLFFGPADLDGTIDAPLEIPGMPGQDTTIVVQAEAAGKKAELRMLVKKSVEAAPRPAG